jgi:hypothetical protein
MNNSGEIIVKENISKDQTIRTRCNKCGQEMNHKVLMDYCESGKTILGSDIDLYHGKIDYTADFSNDYQIVKCSGCDIVSYRNHNYFSECQDIDGSGGTWEERFPAFKERPEKNFKNLPPLFMKIYQEIITVYNNDGFILCAAGIRALLEGICKEKGITKGDLLEKIQNMQKQGIISKHHEDILDNLRLMGNEVLHELQVPAREEIKAALNIIEHIIEDLYEITEKVKILKEGKKKAK